MSDIAIVGGGFCGVSVLLQTISRIQKQGLKPVSITIFSKKQPLGPGIPYNLDLDPEILLNHTADDMAALNVYDPDAKGDDFFKWLGQNKFKLQKKYPKVTFTDPKEVVPRSLYGCYIVDRVREAKEFARSNGIQIIEQHATVTNILHTKDANTSSSKTLIEYKKNDGDTESTVFDRTVLAPGVWYSKNKEFKAKNGFFPAYPIEKYTNKKSFDPDLEYVIQGSGQTADEVALALVRAGAKHVTMVSRHGFLHAIRAPYEPYNRTILTSEKLRAMVAENGSLKLHEVANLFALEMEHAYGVPIDWQEVIHPTDSFVKLKEMFEQAKPQNISKWRSVLVSLGADRQYIYENLNTEDKAKFNNEYKSLFFAYHAPIPLITANRLINAIDSGVLKVYGGAQTTVWNESTKQFDIQLANGHPKNNYVSRPHDPMMPIDNSRLRVIHADVLIQAKGPSREISAQPLLKQLLKSGTIEESCDGGVNIDPQNHMIIKNGKVLDTLFATGQLVFGKRLLVAGTHHHVVDAKTISEQLVAILAKTRTPKIVSSRIKQESTPVTNAL